MYFYVGPTTPPRSIINIRLFAKHGCYLVFVPSGDYIPASYPTDQSPDRTIPFNLFHWLVPGRSRPDLDFFEIAFKEHFGLRISKRYSSWGEELGRWVWVRGYLMAGDARPDKLLVGI